VLSEFPDFNSATKYPDDYQIPGGQNYREILYKLPDDKVEGGLDPRQITSTSPTIPLAPSVQPTAPLTAHRHSLQKRSSPTGQLQGRKRGYKSKIDSNENALPNQYDSLTAERKQS
jgi:hypothetical protein